MLEDLAQAVAKRVDAATVIPLEGNVRKCQSYRIISQINHLSYGESDPKPRRTSSRGPHLSPSRFSIVESLSKSTFSTVMICIINLLTF